MLRRSLTSADITSYEDERLGDELDPNGAGVYVYS